MKDNQKKELLESILKSKKISLAYEKYRSRYKFNKRLMIEKIVEELDTLWNRFKDIEKLKNFLETFISNHIKDFLIKITSKNDYSRSENVSIQQPEINQKKDSSETDYRTDVDPNERNSRT